MCPKCEELAAEMRRRLAIVEAVREELDDLLELIEEPEDDNPLHLMRQNTPAAVEADQQAAKYDPEVGDDARCACGHPYHRHFDSHEDMAPVGCKYCDCDKFAAAEDEEEPEEPTSLDHQHSPSVNGQAKPAAAARKDELQELAEQCPGFVRQEGGKLAHLPLRNLLGGYHKTGDAAIRRAMDQGLITTQKIDGLHYYVIPPKGVPS